MVYAQLATVYLSQSATCDACGGGGTTSVGSESDGRMGQEDGREKQKREEEGEGRRRDAPSNRDIFSFSNASRIKFRNGRKEQNSKLHQNYALMSKYKSWKFARFCFTKL